MKREEKILLWGVSFWWFGEGLFGPLFAIFAGRIGGSILDITWAWAIYLLTTGILEIALGRIFDKVDHTKLMVAGYALNAIFTFCYLFVYTPAGLFLVEAGLGVAAALADPTWDALYAKFGNSNKSGSIWGLENGTEQIITAVSILIGGMIVNYFSFVILFVIMGVIQTVGVIFQTRMLYVRKT